MAGNCVGLDIGSSSIKMLQVTGSAKSIQLLDFGIEPLPPAVMDVAAFTVQSAFEVSYDAVPGESVALINIGAAISNINIITDGTSIFTRDVTVGGGGFTEEIQKRVHVNSEEAEGFKIA